MNYVIAVLFIFLLITPVYAQSPETVIQDFEEGVAAFESGNHSAALQRLRPLAEQGYAPAQYYLGVAYANGFGLPADDFEAVRWFLAAAEQGVPASETAAAEMYAAGRGVTQDCDEALKWLRKAASRGFPPAESILGTWYALGQCVAQNYEEAVNWTRSAAEQGEPGAQFHLGLAYHQGTVVRRDPVQAYKWYSLAAAVGMQEATHNLEILSNEMSADQIDEGLRQASEWRAKTFTQLSKRSVEDQDQATLSGLERGDFEAYFRESLKEAQSGDPRGQANVAMLYHRGMGVEKNLTEAIFWFRKAAAQGIAEAQYSLGLMYMHGEGVLRDELAAFDWWQKAADQGHPSAQYNLGLMYLGREKITADPVQAYLWFDLARVSYGLRASDGAVMAEARDDAVNMRHKVSRMMTYQQKQEAEGLVREWLEAHPQ